MRYNAPIKFMKEVIKMSNNDQEFLVQQGGDRLREAGYPFYPVEAL